MPEASALQKSDARSRPLKSAEITELLDTVLDNPDAWLSEPSPHFGGRKPLDLIGTEEEQKIVDLLRAVDEGLF